MSFADRALDLLVESVRQRRQADDVDASLHAEIVPLKLFSLGVTTTAPSADIGALMTNAAAALEKLDNVAMECRTLGGSLSALSLQAEAAVRRVRDLDVQRARLQAALERVDDIIDLRSCLGGVQVAMQCQDWDQAAMHVSRFRSLEASLPIPDADIAFMRNAEATLVATVTAQFDAAVSAASAALMRDSTASSESANATGGQQAYHATIARCCQLMTMLGHADSGLSRYADFLRESVAFEASGEMRAAVAAGLTVDQPGVALNILSAVLSRAVTALESASPLVASLFADERGPTAVLAGVHGVCDRAAARIVISVLRSARVHAALLAREPLITLCGDRATARRTAQRQLDLSASISGSEGVPQLSTTDASRLLEQIEDLSCAAPLVLLPLSSQISHIFNGRDFADPMTFDAVVDELALILQRCSSYLRLIMGRAAEAGAQQRARRLQQQGHVAHANAASDAASTAAATVDSAASNDMTPEAAVRKSSQLLEASLELGGVYSALEYAKLHGGVAKAICIDELVDEGAQGAGLDILSPLHLDAVGASSSHSHGAPGVTEEGEAIDALVDAAEGSSQAGAGAMVSTVVEDAFYVCTLAGRRAFATGNADAAAGVVNHIVTAVSDRLLPELEARLRLAFDDGPAGVAATAPGGGAVGGGTSGLPQAQVERISLLRTALMSSTPVKLAAAKLSAYQAAVPSPSRVGTGSFTSPLLQLAAANRASGTAGRDGPGTPLVGGNTGGPTNASGRSAAPTARLTEEVAASALALNNLQLAIECALQLQRTLQRDLTDYFSVATGRDAAKVGNCISSLVDVAVTLRRALDTGLTTLSARLTPRLRSALNAFEGTSSLIQYELSEEAFALSSAGVEGHNAFGTEFLPILASILAPLQYALTPALANAVLTKVATYVAKQLEPRIRRKRVNQLGGLQFDSDMRALAGFFAVRSGRRIRSRFTRLLQMAHLLTLESPAEVLEYWGPNASVVPWELSSDEVRATLLLRTDFLPHDIARLRL